MRRSSLRVFFPTARQPGRLPASFEVMQVDAHHDMVALDYYAEKHTALRYREGTPIVVRWGVFPNNFEDFYGYVLYIRPRIENEHHILRVVCIGAGAPLQGVTEGVFQNSTYEDVATRISLAHRLNIVRPKGTHAWPLLIQPRNATEFQYLVQCAERQGYLLFINKTTVHFYDPVKALLANAASVPILRYQYGRGNQYYGDIVRFVPSTGETSKRPLRHRVFSQVDLHTKQIITLSSTDQSAARSLYQQQRQNVLTEFLTGQPMQTLCEGEQILNGLTASSRWTLSGKVHGRGNARVRQGSGVFLTGISKEHDGLWYVTKAIHRMTTEGHPQSWSYMMDLELLRDGSPATLQRPPAGRQRRALVTDRKVQVNRRPPPTRLYKGQWASSNPTVTVVSL